MSTVVVIEFNSHQLILKQTVRQSLQLIEDLLMLIVKGFQDGNKVLLCGDGGGAADAQQISAEFINRFASIADLCLLLHLLQILPSLQAVGND